jgi:hypothetical protein
LHLFFGANNIDELACNGGVWNGMLRIGVQFVVIYIGGDKASNLRRHSIWTYNYKTSQWGGRREKYIGCPRIDRVFEGG